MPEFTPQPFDHQALGRLTCHLSPALFNWAIRHPVVRKSAETHQLIRDLAAIHALGKAILAKARLRGFEKAVERNYRMNQQYFDLQYRTPQEMAGTAAGQLAIAKLLTVWYGLGPEDLHRLRAPHSVSELMDVGAPGLQDAVCTAPQELGITSFTAHDVYTATDRRVKGLVAANGPTALQPFVAFAHYPIIV